VLEQGVSAVLGRLHDPAVDVGTERQPVGAVDAPAAQNLHRLGDMPWAGRHVVFQRDRRMRGRHGDPCDPRRLPAAEDRDVLGQGQPPRRVAQILEIGVLGAATDIGELGAPDGERDARLDPVRARVDEPP
jgi:hypothetical protein